MTDENKKDETKGESGKLSFKTADDLTSFLMDLKGQVDNMQEMIDKQSPVEETSEEGTEPSEGKEELSDEEISEIDRLLQSE